MAIVWGWLFERTAPDGFDVLGIILAIIGVIVIFYMPRKRNGEKSIWSRQQ
jgi:small multidrug resistance family-3 protein